MKNFSDNDIQIEEHTDDLPIAAISGKLGHPQKKFSNTISNPQSQLCEFNFWAFQQFFPFQRRVIFP